MVITSLYGINRSIICNVIFIYVYFAVYDVLTGKIVTKLQHHQACVRDVSWHPFENSLVSSSV